MNIEKDFVCKRCGKCCLACPNLSATKEDIERWIGEERWDILQHVHIWFSKDKIDPVARAILRDLGIDWNGCQITCPLWKQFGSSTINLNFLKKMISWGDLWFRPRDKELPKSGDPELRRCPFLRKLPKKDKYKCLIHDTKPEVCRMYTCVEKEAGLIGTVTPETEVV